MRHAFNDQPHFAFENVDDLLLWMRVRWHLTTRRKCGEHLIHRFAVCDRSAGDSGANFNRRICCFHFRRLRRVLVESLNFFYPKLLVTCHWRLVTVTMHSMKTFTSLITILFAGLIAMPLFAQTSATSPAVG